AARHREAGASRRPHSLASRPHDSKPQPRTPRNHNQTTNLHLHHPSGSTGNPLSNHEAPPPRSRQLQGHQDQSQAQ
ncbi:hypothetical protein BKA80DRAFT_303295, partial [Phyllosticta citrichinensis]